MPDLTDFQLEVTRLFFSLPVSRGFLLDGGAALLAQHLTTRSKEDLDFFTAPDRGHVPAARDALEAAARERGWVTERIHDSDTFCRFVIRSDTGEVATENGSPTSSVSEKLVDRYCFRILFVNCDVSPAGVCRGRQR